MHPSSPSRRRPPFTVALKASTAILALSLGFAGLIEAADAATKVPLPKPRPLARSAAPKNVAKSLPAPDPRPSTKLPVTSPAAAVEPMRQRPPAAALHKPATRSAIAATASTSSADAGALENVIELARKKRAGEATEVANTISDPVARKLAEWVILRSEDNGASVERYAAFVRANPSWPSQSFLRRRAEAALWDDRRDDSAVLAYFEDERPSTGKGKLALARALLARGDRRTAEQLVRDAWRNDTMSEATETTAMELFGPLITPSDHKARMDSFLYGDDLGPALRAAKRLGAAQLALARARIAVDKKASNGKALLAAVPSELHHDPGFLFSKIQVLRRDDMIAEAGRLMLTVPRDPARLHNLDEWWIERRLVARKLIDIGDYRLAYLVARDAATPTKAIYKTEHEFTAGWIALRFLNDPATAALHFARLGRDTTNPTALARAGYWQGRAAEAAGRIQEARAAYSASAAHSTSYYGQLSRAKLGLAQLDLNGPPSGGRNADRLEIVRAVSLLYAIDEGEMAIPIFADVGENGDVDALIGLSEVAERRNDARAMLLVGKAALNRGLPFDHYAYPVNGIPQFRSVGPDVERAIVYAIARQESAFNPAVVSPANAYGLMQVTPDAGKYVCRRHGCTFDLQRLKTDSVYNAALGAAELGGLIEDYRGSYIMTFAGYNAGRGSVRKWVERYGDPRDPKVDAVDWVELIPFAETRNYVQRIIENLQVYRARFGGGHRLQIEADLRRGAGVGAE
ncbi:transglycosylase SLT domain-containing protein [Rhodopseudomonas palustris]|uniref:transglycosylase SLT domain-containing protein n=1 Tax=Rhodopseudomonas palustris TaxID=1076 RepID=UPI0022F12830|nr:transglycosylase SLT domain-containing protein [Rhodopseudomonas palustris]WBU27642.1 transglycosylase SLT domain-containing protein [Rhodopseudomonas palustris]